MVNLHESPKSLVEDFSQSSRRRTEHKEEGREEDEDEEFAYLRYDHERYEPTRTEEAGDNAPRARRRKTPNKHEVSRRRAGKLRASCAFVVKFLQKR
jgi:hypothetical protein